jgi:hypothetical protein
MNRQQVDANNSHENGDASFTKMAYYEELASVLNNRTDTFSASK